MADDLSGDGIRARRRRRGAVVRRLINSREIPQRVLSGICTMLLGVCIDDEVDDDIASECLRLRREGRWKVDQGVVRAMFTGAGAAELAEMLGTYYLPLMVSPAVFGPLFRRAFELNKSNPRALRKIGIGLGMFMGNNSRIRGQYAKYVRRLVAHPQLKVWTVGLEALGMLPDIRPEEVELIRRALSSRRGEVRKSALVCLRDGLSLRPPFPPALKKLIESEEVQEILTALAKRGERDELGFHAIHILAVMDGSWEERAAKRRRALRLRERRARGRAAERQE